MQLANSERFKNEYNSFKEKINAIQNETAKKQLNGLLNQLVAEVRAIDRQHEDLSMSFKLSNNTTDHRSNLTDIRKKIIAMLENCKV
jgi:predicted nuclease with TOPRIM domain